MRNRLRAAIACLRGRPVVANCRIEAPFTLGHNPRATIIGNTITRSNPLTLNVPGSTRIVGNTITPR